MAAPRPSPSTLGGLVVLLLGGAFVVWAGQVAALHCDETNVFRHATNFADGRFRTPGRPGLLWLLLAPLTWLGDPVLVSRAMRLAASLASVGTLWAVWQLSSHRGERRGVPSASEAWGGVLGAALLVSAFDWQAHAYELRTDTFVLPLSLGAMALLWRSRLGLRRAAMAGLLIAAIGLISQKSIYNAGAIGLGWGVFVLASGGPLQLRQRGLEALCVAGTALAAMGLWFGGLALLNADGGAAVGHTFQVATRTAFGLDDIDLEKKTETLLFCVGRSPVLWACFALSVPWALLTARRRPRIAAAAVAALAMVATIFVHRGFRPYFVASFEPYLAVVAGAGLASLVQTLRQRLPAVVAVLPALLLVGGGLWLARPAAALMVATTNEQQFALMRDVREAFPEPVPYWDLIGLVPGYREVTFLGTGPQRSIFRKRAGARAAHALGEEAPGAEQQRARRRGERRAFIERARERKPLFFIRNYMSRDRYMWRRGSEGDGSPELSWLWTHYLPYRPNLYLHGGRILVPEGGAESEHSVELLVDGPYTVWFRGGWKGSAWLGDEALRHQDRIEVQAGRHTLRAEAEEGSGELWLLFGGDREPAFERVVDQRDYSMFPLDQRERYQWYDNKRSKPGDLLTPRWDPQLPERQVDARTRRHRAYQERRQERDSSP